MQPFSQPLILLFGSLNSPPLSYTMQFLSPTRRHPEWPLILYLSTKGELYKIM